MAFLRQESVNEEDLFGAGRANTSRSPSSPSVGHLLPDFDLLGVTSKEDPESAEDSSVDTKKGSSGSADKVASSAHHVYSDSDNRKHSSNDFKTVFRGKGSISAIEGRKHFGRRSDIEVFEDDVIYDDIAPKNATHVIHKSNSLPDLVISSSGSISPSIRFPSEGSSPVPSNSTRLPASLPSKINLLEERKHQKEAFEGKATCLPKSKDSTNVSFRNTPDTIIEVADENLEDKNGEVERDSANGSMDKHDDEEASKKRNRYSRSSGYQTGSASDSQDKSKGTGSIQSQISTVGYSEGTTDIWTSNDNQDDKEFTGNMPLISGFGLSTNNFDSLKEGNLPIMSGFTSVTFDNPPDISVTEQSNGTRTSSTDESNNSHNTAINKSSKTDELHNLDVDDKNLLKKEHQSEVEFKRLKTDSFSMDVKGGNLPHVVERQDSSVCIGDSTINQINQEENEKLARRVQAVQGNAPLQPGSFLTLQDNRSSITDSSMLNVCHIQYLQSCLKAGLDVQTVLKHIQDQDNFSPSPSPADIGRMYSPGQTFTSTCLHQASRCHKKGCTFKPCEKFAAINKVLEKEILTEDVESELVKQYFEALYQHHDECDDLWCKVKYCQRIDSWNVARTNLLKMTECFQHERNDPLMSVFVSKKFSFHSIRIKEGPQYKGNLKSLVPISKLGTFGSALLCLDPAQQACVVKEYALFDERHHSSLYSRLCEKHPYIVDQLWMVEHEDRIQVCSDFMPGGSLNDYMMKFGPLPWKKVMGFVHQMLSALTFLHKNGVVYLNWHSKNMLFWDTSYCRVKLSNFTVSCPLGTCYDIGAVKQCLLPALAPPELIQTSTVHLLSDMWGVGCMVFELLTGQVVWSEYTHESRDYIHKKIRGKRPVQPDNVTQDQSTVFTACWKLDPQDRYSTEKLYDCITAHLRKTEYRGNV